MFNGNYARYWDDAATDWLQDAGFGGKELGGIGTDVLTARLEIDFKNSASLGDTLLTDTSVEKLGNTSMTVHVTTTRHSDGQLVAEGRMVWVFVDPATHRPTAIPDQIRSALAPD